MRNWREIDEIWCEYCQQNNGKLHRKERNYFYGKTQLYETEEEYQDYRINFRHRFEKPDRGVRPEELILTFTSKTHTFPLIAIEKRGYISGLINSEVLKIKSDFLVPEEVEVCVKQVADKYASLEFKSFSNQLQLIINDFPRSIKELEMLKESILEIKKGISCYEKPIASTFPKEPTKEAVQEALNNRNGWVYVIESKYKKTDTIPPDAILGAWKVNASGIITGNFIPNPNYKKEC